MGIKFGKAHFRRWWYSNIVEIKVIKIQPWYFIITIDYSLWN